MNKATRQRISMAHARHAQREADRKIENEWVAFALDNGPWPSRGTGCTDGPSADVERRREEQMIVGAENEAMRRNIALREKLLWLSEREAKANGKKTGGIHAA